jgi:hypothetical protein
LALFGLQAISRYSLDAFDFLGDCHCCVFLSLGHGNSGRQGHDAFVGFYFDIGAWNTFFGDQVSLDLGGDPGIGGGFLGL